jgi:hypothetical protein
MHSIARNCDVLGVEEIVAFLSHALGAIWARPSGSARRTEFDFRITITCSTCGETHMKLWFNRDATNCRITVVSVCSAFFSYRGAIPVRHGRSFEAVSATSWDLGLVCGSSYALRSFSFALMRAGLLADAHRALLGPYRIGTSLSSRRRFSLMIRNEYSTEDAINSVHGVVTLQAEQGVAHLLRLGYEGSSVVALSRQAR